MFPDVYGVQQNYKIALLSDWRDGQLVSTCCANMKSECGSMAPPKN